jgi:hypothetical protein
LRKAILVRAELASHYLLKSWSWLALAGEALGEEDFEQGLIGHVAVIGEYLQVLDHGKRQAQGDGLESGLEAGRGRLSLK